MRAKGKPFRFVLLGVLFIFLFSGCGGSGGGGGDDVSGEPDDNTAPSTPTGLAAEADTSTTVYLSWDASTDNVEVAGYVIYRDGVEIIDLYDPDYLEYDDADLTPETTYSYTVSAYDPTGNESAQSAPAEVTTLPIMVVQFGTTEDDTGRGVGVDATGNVYVAGETSGTLEAPALGGQDAYLRKFDTNKDTVWTVQFGTSAEEVVRALAVDPAGNSYAAGSTDGDFAAAAAGKDALLVKFDADGDKKWALQPQTASIDEAWAVAVDSVNSFVYLSGMTYGTMGGTPNAGNADIFLSQFDLGGEPQWIRQGGTSENDWTFALASDSGGNVYAVGQTNEDLDGLAGSGTHAGGADAFLLKYDSAGTLQWVAQWGTADFDYANGVAVDTSGNVYVTGITEGTLNGTSAGAWDIFLAKFDSTDGSQEWIRQTGSSSDDYSRSLAIFDDENIYITGTTLGLINDIGEGGSDIFLVVYDSDGNLLDQTQGGSSGNDEAGGIVIDSSNDCFYITGHTDGDVDGNMNLGGTDALLIKMSLEGELQ